ncbi:thiol peroxidase [Metamycoplasma auris]|uniref:Thiol peroxidase (Atypical 2-Cys peroxiredoxin) n=1 Tax=Metamycoplasma auris TaxID=51363 RepID=A0A2W7HZ90_9BACT|nr:thiol peroxidase [Metamycoplasma auris]PZW00546.1 thiol peroxidase (atypical 2-Cys peroxiredoxin) [Metamycoplasma auris]
MKVKFGSDDVNLLGNEIRIGDTFPNFMAVDLDFNDFELSSLPKTKKLILSIPSIDTGVCETETTKFMNYFINKEYPVLVISQDLPFALGRWCAIRNNKTIQTLSEFKYKDFGRKTGTLLEGKELLTRAVFVLDENNKVLYVDYVKVVGHEPNYEEILRFF